MYLQFRERWKKVAVAMFQALLTKELRLRLRSEHIAWVLVAYIIIMSLLGWLIFEVYGNLAAYSGSSETGIILYYALILLQLLFILCTTPAYTSTSINGEKERQTFDLLLCSQLSAFSLILGKLVAGIANALLLVIATMPVFSLVFFFGGISLIQFMGAFLIYGVTVLLIASLGLFYSTVIRRPAISTMATYVSCLFWLTLPIFITAFLWPALTAQYPSNGQDVLLFAWNPFIAIMSMSPDLNALPPFWLHIPIWLVYITLSVCAALLFFLLSVRLVRPVQNKRNRDKLDSVEQESVTVAV